LVLTGANNPPQARVSASQRTACVGSIVKFNDVSTTTAHSISWTFPGGTPSSSTLSNPTVMYTTPGVYMVSMTISDSLNNYTFTDSNFITVVNSPRIDSLIKTPNNCNGNGSILAQVSGGYSPYHYTWAPGTFPDSIAIVGLRAGLYTLLVTDSNGCTATANTTVTDNGPVVAATVTTPINCYGGNNGVATASVTGGVAPFSYTWQTTPPQNGAVLPNLVAGTYRVHLTDGAGCTSDTSITLAQPDSFTIINFSNPNTGGGNGSAGVSVFGATPPYTYSWNTTPPQTSNAAFNLYGGPVQVTVTDSKGCSKIITIQVSGAGLGVVDHSLPTFQMFPSPSDGLVMMYFENQSNQTAQLEITSVDGKKVADYQFGNQPTMAKELNLSHLSNGVYFATLRTSKAEKKVRFVVQH
jgi:PKD repeat protein